MRLRPVGDRALLLDCDSLDEARGWHAALADADAVMGARTVLLRGEPADLRALVERTAPVDLETVDARTVEVPVVYDGEDLDEVASLTGLSADEVVAAHTGSEWVAAFGGFAPGFAYLVGGDPRLQVPRRSDPRTRVPAGSIGLAGEFSAVYPRSSPGGWQLIGRTDLPTWDVRRDPPALVTAGTRVRFVVADR